MAELSATYHNPPRLLLFSIYNRLYCAPASLAAEQDAASARQPMLATPTPRMNPQGDTVSFHRHMQLGQWVVVRHTNDRLRNPDRLNLDNRELHDIPIIDGEPQIRLLNFQHNLITSMAGIGMFRNLLFLDMYDNQVTEIAHLDRLPSLRVLM